MRLISLEVESTLRDKGLWPQSWVGWAALYVLALDLLLFAVQSRLAGSAGYARDCCGGCETV